MSKRNVLVIVEPTLEVWSGLKRLCKAKGDELPYSKLQYKKFPIIYNGWKILKEEFHYEDDKTLIQK
jgi:hypothetical protein